MALAEVAVRKAKPEAKAYKMADGGGMYLLVQTGGGKLWRMDYRYAGKRKTLALGSYPEVSLSDAREKREAARKMLAADIDPNAAKKAKKESAKTASDNSFEVVAREWLAKFSKNWKETHTYTIRTRLENDVIPWIGARPINEITAPELLTVLRRVESRGALDTAHRIRAFSGQIFRYAVATGRAERDPSNDLKGALPPHRGKHLAAITDPVQIGKLLRDIEGYRGSYVVCCAFRLAPMVFLRPIELCSAEWAHIDLDKAEWRIPAEKMKMRAPHVVPLAAQAVAILRDLYPLTGRSPYVFPGIRNPLTEHMAKNTIMAAIRALGYENGEMTSHGFRHMASTVLNEQGFNADVIERQLAHKARGVRAVYNAAEYMPERRRMMQAWADFLDALKSGAQVIPLKAAS